MVDDAGGIQSAVGYRAEREKGSDSDDDDDREHSAEGAGRPAERDVVADACGDRPEAQAGRRQVGDVRLHRTAPMIARPAACRLRVRLPVCARILACAARLPRRRAGPMTARDRQRRRRRRSSDPARLIMIGFAALLGNDRRRDRGRARLRRLGRRRRPAAEPAQADQQRGELHRLRGRRVLARHDPLRHDPHADPVGADSVGPQGGDRGDRGSALLPAPRRRLPGDHSRGDGRPDLRQDAPGRLDDHDAAGPQPLRRRRREDVEAQDQRRPCWPNGWRRCTTRTGS